MSWEWYGRGADSKDGVIWENEITRYFIVVEQDVHALDVNGQDYIVISKGYRYRLNKSEARKFMKNGYFEHKMRQYNPNIGRYEVALVPLSGELVKEVEKRVLREAGVDPAELNPPRKAKS